MADRVNRFTDLKLPSDNSTIVVSVERKRGGAGRVTVVVNFDPDQIAGIEVVVQNCLEAQSQHEKIGEQ